MFYYICKHCGTIVSLMKPDNKPPLCCESRMTKLKPESIDLDIKKHVPITVTELSVLKQISGF